MVESTRRPTRILFGKQAQKIGMLYREDLIPVAECFQGFHIFIARRSPFTQRSPSFYWHAGEIALFGKNSADSSHTGARLRQCVDRFFQQQALVSDRSATLRIQLSYVQFPFSLLNKVLEAIGKVVKLRSRSSTGYSHFCTSSA